MRTPFTLTYACKTFVCVHAGARGDGGTLQFFSYIFYFLHCLFHLFIFLSFLFLLKKNIYLSIYTYIHTHKGCSQTVEPLMVKTGTVHLSCSFSLICSVCDCSCEALFYIQQSICWTHVISWQHLLIFWFIGKHALECFHGGVKRLGWWKPYNRALYTSMFLFAPLCSDNQGWWL